MRRINKKAFGEYIRERRIEKGYTQEELAGRLNVSNMSISKWENGRRYPDLEMLDDLARELEVSVEDIYENSRREVVGGFPINIGMIVFILIVGIIAATGVLKVSKDKDNDNQNEDNTEDEEVLYQFNYGVYVNLDSDDVLKNYIEFFDSGNANTGLTYADYASTYKYRRNGNIIEMRAFNDNGIIYEYTEAELIDDNTVLWDGITYKITSTNLNGIVIKTDSGYMFYFEDIGVTEIVNLEKLVNYNKIEKLQTGDYVCATWLGDFYIITANICAATVDDLNIISEEQLDKNSDIVINKSKIIREVTEQVNSLGYE